MSKIGDHFNSVFQGKAVRVDAVDENGNINYDAQTPSGAEVNTYYECRFFCILYEGDILSEQYLLALRHFSPSGYEDGVLVLEEPYDDAARELERGGWAYAKPDEEDGNIFDGNKRYHITFLTL